MINGLLIGAFFSYMLFVMGIKVFNKSEKYNYKIFLVQLCYTVLYALNYYNNNIVSNIVIEILLIILFFKLLFREKVIRIVYYGIIIYSIHFLLEFIVLILDETVFYYYQILKFLSSHEAIKCLMAGIITTYIVINNKEKLQKFLSTKQLYSMKYIVLMLLILLLMLIIINFRKYMINPFPQLQIAAELIVLLLFTIIFHTILKQRKKIDGIEKQYTEATEYYKMTEGLLEEYRYILHENKNQLLIIKSMVKDNPELEEYLNHLINGRRNLKYEWVCDLKNIPIQGLKGLVNYKIAEMKRKNLNVEIYIDDEIGKIKIKSLNQKEQHELYSIIGIFLDNALEASSISEEKMVSIQCYKEKDQVHIMIANTYAGEVDLKKIRALGYSSKGKNRGVGIPLVIKIVENSPIYKNETELFDIFFVQHLYIQLPNNTEN